MPSPTLVGLYTPLHIPRAYRATEGGERACNVNSPHVYRLCNPKNNTSAHAREYKCTNGKQIDTIEYGPLQSRCLKITWIIKWCVCRIFRNYISHTLILFLVTFRISPSTCIACPLAMHWYWALPIPKFVNDDYALNSLAVYVTYGLFCTGIRQCLKYHA